jgi:hypothetical protein
MSNQLEKNKISFPVSLPGQLQGQIPGHYLKSTEWRSHLSLILAKKISESELVAMMRRSLGARTSQIEEEPDNPSAIGITLESEFRFELLNKQELKKRLAATIKSRIGLEDLLAACEKCLKRRGVKKEVEK